MPSRRSGGLRGRRGLSGVAWLTDGKVRNFLADIESVYKRLLAMGGRDPEHFRDYVAQLVKLVT